MKKKAKTGAAPRAVGTAPKHNNFKLRPLGDRVVVEPISEFEREGQSASGIIIPDTVSKEKSEEGRVVAVGEGKLTDEGKRLPIGVAVGDRIIFAKYGPDEVKVDGKEYYIMSESHILAIIK